MSTNMQIGIEQQRALYSHLAKPLLRQMCDIHHISVREFASIFGLSRGYADNIMNYRTMPTLEVAFKIARYFECGMEELWGWMFDDDGSRRPLMAEMPGTKMLMRLRTNKEDSAMNLVRMVAEGFRVGYYSKEAKK